MKTSILKICKSVVFLLLGLLIFSCNKDEFVDQKSTTLDVPTVQFLSKEYVVNSKNTNNDEISFSPSIGELGTSNLTINAGNQYWIGWYLTLCCVDSGDCCTWSSAMIDIKLYKDDSFVSDIALKVPFNNSITESQDEPFLSGATGAYLWAVSPTLLGSNYSIRISDSDYNDGDVTSPLGSIPVSFTESFSIESGVGIPKNIKAEFKDISNYTDYVNITWEDNTTDEIGFEVQRSVSLGSGFTTVKNVGAGITRTTHPTHSGNSVYGRTYYYRVRAKLSNGDFSGWSSVVQTSYKYNSPSNLAVEFVNSTNFSDLFRLKWDDNSANEQNFEIQKSTNPKFGFVTISPFAGGGANSELASHLVNSSNSIPGQRYYFRVRASYFNGANKTDWSNVASAVYNP